MKLLHKGLLVILVPLIFQLVLLGMVGAELSKFQDRLARVYQSKEKISTTLELVRDVFSDYQNMTITLEAEGQYDPVFVRASCLRLSSKIQKLAATPDVDSNQQQYLNKLNQTAVAYFRLLDWALGEQRKGHDQWLKVDNEFFDNTYKLLETFLTNASKIATAEQGKATYETEIQNAHKQLSLLLSIALPLSLLSSTLLALLYARSISQPLKRILQNSQLLAQQKELLPALKGRAELSKLDRHIHRVADSVYELLRSEKTLVEQAAETICSLNRDGDLKRINKSGEKLLGKAAAQLIGSNIIDLVHNDERLLADEYLHKACKQANTSRFTLTLVNASGQTIKTSWSAHWSQVDQLLFCVIKDVTEEKRIEGLKQQFREIISHELRQPLLAIHEALQAVASGSCGNMSAEAAREISICQNNVSTLMELVDNLLDFTRIEQGHLLLDKAPIDLREIALEAAKLLDDLAGEKSVSIQIAGSISSLPGDREKLLQIFLNLLTNALKFSPKNGQITVNLKDESDAALVEIRDQGPGVSAEFESKIFAPFEQDPHGQQKGGYGLGLAICKMIIEAHKGKLGVRRVESPRGSIFWFSLPH